MSSEEAMDDISRFYDGLSDSYHLIFADWGESMQRQAQVLDGLLRARLGPPPRVVLDCACGIGTQAIGLALRGYDVTASDVSAGAVERAQREAGALGAQLSFGVADMRTLSAQVRGPFDAVIACDNALPHLLTEDDLLSALREMAAVLRPGGLLLASIRDYDALLDERPNTTTPRVFDGPDGRRVVIQVWDWLPGTELYDFTLLIVQQAGDGWQTQAHTTRYRALRRADLVRAVRAAGLDDLHWHMPPESGYYQPIITARKPAMESA
jgi:glycine/sarcosine N-methyltransferase